MPLLPKPGAVLFVANVPKMTQFYQTLGSMALLREDSDHAVLELEGFQLVVHALRAAPDAPPTLGDLRRVREDAPVKLCIPVPSIAAARTAAAALGGMIQPTASEWLGRGFRACDGNDPEGNVLQVRQGAA